MPTLRERKSAAAAVGEDRSPHLSHLRSSRSKHQAAPNRAQQHNPDDDDEVDDDAEADGSPQRQHSKSSSFPSRALRSTGAVVDVPSSRDVRGQEAESGGGRPRIRVKLAGHSLELGPLPADSHSGDNAGSRKSRSQGNVAGETAGDVDDVEEVDDDEEEEVVIEEEDDDGEGEEEEEQAEDEEEDADAAADPTEGAAPSSKRPAPSRHRGLSGLADSSGWEGALRGKRERRPVAIYDPNAGSLRPAAFSRRGAGGSSSRGAGDYGGARSGTNRLTEEQEHEARYPRRERQMRSITNMREREAPAQKPRYRFATSLSGGAAGGRRHRREHFDSSSESDGSGGSDSMPGGPLDSSGSEGEAGVAPAASSSRRRGFDPSVLEGFLEGGGRSSGGAGGAAAPSRGGRRGDAGGGKRSGGGGGRRSSLPFGPTEGARFDGEDEADFSRAQDRRHAEDVAAIQPINAPLAAAGGKKGGGAQDGNFKYTKRDIVRADADPVAVDASVSFKSVGGLDGHLRALKEMVTLPLLYPELFTRFGIRAPRGVLFHGPPGTGKTLVARALANQSAAGSQRISFFMVKGAQLLSKWLGESERQLRLIFEQAKRMAPAIVFFDEFDGIAPVRSTKQDAIHSSIVATLLALMDGLDDRGQVIVIGATNRPDAIDPALRRPGRFDRELYFPLPSVTARRSILDIHTRVWSPPLTAGFKDALARATVGYCGADIASLCAEAALRAVRRRFSAIYDSDVKLWIEPETVNVTLGDFTAAMRDCIPAAARSATSGQAAPVPPHLLPLLRGHLSHAVEAMQRVFPFVKRSAAALMIGAGGGEAAAPAASGSTAAGAPLAHVEEEAGGGGYDSDNSAAMAAVYGHLNSDDCITCGQAGDLVCCDTCSSSYHTLTPSEAVGGRGKKGRKQQRGAALPQQSSSSPAAAAEQESEPTAAAATPAWEHADDEMGGGGADSQAASQSPAAAGGPPLLHPSSCIPASCPLPDLLSDAPWNCPRCLEARAAAAHAAEAVLASSSSSAAASFPSPPALPAAVSSSTAPSNRASRGVNVDAVLASSGKRTCFRPRLVLYMPRAPAPAAAQGAAAAAGSAGTSAASSLPVTLARALLHIAEELPVFSIDMPSLLSDSNTRSPIEALALRMGEARRSAPSILFLPRADEWWSLADDSLRAALVHACESIPSDAPVLLLSTLCSAAGEGGRERGEEEEVEGAPAASTSSSAAAAFHAGGGRQQQHQQHRELPTALCRLLFNSPTVPAEDGGAAASSSSSSRAASALPLAPIPASGRAAFFGGLWEQVLPRPSALAQLEPWASSSSASLLSAAENDTAVPAPAAHDAAIAAALEDTLYTARRRHERRTAKRARDETQPRAAPPPAPPPPPTAAELAAARKAARGAEEKYLSSLRLGLRSVLDDLARDPKFRPFTVPVDPEEVADYYEVVSVPMDFSTMADKLEAGAYLCFEDFLLDLQLIHTNCREYNPATDRDSRGRRLVRNSAAIIDFANLEFADYNRRVGGKLQARCQRICARRVADGDAPLARKFMGWGVPESAAARRASEAAVHAQTARVYGPRAGVSAAAAGAALTAAATAAATAAGSDGAAAGTLRLTRRSSRHGAEGAPVDEYAMLVDAPRRRGASSSSRGDAAAASAAPDSAAAVPSDGSDVIVEVSSHAGDEGDAAAASGATSAAPNEAGAAGSRPRRSGVVVVESDDEEGAAGGFAMPLASAAAPASSSSSSSSSAGAQQASSGAAASLLDDNDAPMRPPPAKRARSPSATAVPEPSSTGAAGAGGLQGPHLPTSVNAPSIGDAPFFLQQGAPAAAADGAALSSEGPPRGSSAPAAADLARAAAAAEAALELELGGIRASVAEYRVLRARAAALLSRIVEGTEGWDVDRLDRLRYQLSSMADDAAADARRQGAAAAQAHVRERLLANIEKEAVAWGL